MSRVLVTGGSGYVGVHTCSDLLANGHEVFVVDNFSNSTPRLFENLIKLSDLPIDLAEIDIRDTIEVQKVFSTYKPEVVVHLAGLKSVEESLSSPLSYYDTNVVGSLNLLEAMTKSRCDRLVFSSSATVYGLPRALPIDETHPLQPVNPYGHSKAFVEQMIKDWQNADFGRRAICLRYFNPIGAHPSGLLGELPKNSPKNIFPIISGIFAGRYECLEIYGADYDTRDGTGERDYIHIMDLARAHTLAIANHQECSFEIVNVGTGKGTTVKELIETFETVVGVKIKCSINDRRLGDVDSCFADASKARDVIGWKHQKSIFDACIDQWNWEKYRSAHKI